MKKLLVILFLLMAVSANALTPIQRHNLNLAHTIGSEYGWPETAQTLIMQESLAGEATKFGDRNQSPQKRTYGLGHMSLETAKEEIVRHFGHKVYANDDQLIIALVTNDKFAIHLVMWRFQYLVKKFKKWDKALLAYNAGPGTVQRHGYKRDPNDYITKCIWRLKNQVRPYNDRNLKANKSN